MNKSNEFSQALTDIGTKTDALFKALIKKYKEFNFISELDGVKNLSLMDMYNTLKLLFDSTIDLDGLPIIEFKDENTGDVFSAYVIRITKNGFELFTTDDEEYKELTYSNISSLENRLVILNEMEEFIKE